MLAPLAPNLAWDTKPASRLIAFYGGLTIGHCSPSLCELPLMASCEGNYSGLLVLSFINYVSELAMSLWIACFGIPLITICRVGFSLHIAVVCLACV
jgi:hypothetical protein